MLAVEVATYLQWKISSRSTRSMLPIMSGGCTSNILPRVAVVGIGTWLLGVEHHKHDAVRLGIQLGGKHNPQLRVVLGPRQPVLLAHTML
jgi:hypothetical protein